MEIVLFILLFKAPVTLSSCSVANFLLLLSKVEFNTISLESKLTTLNCFLSFYLRLQEDGAEEKTSPK